MGHVQEILQTQVEQKWPWLIFPIMIHKTASSLLEENTQFVWFLTWSLTLSGVNKSNYSTGASWFVHGLLTQPCLSCDIILIHEKCAVRTQPSLLLSLTEILLRAPILCAIVTHKTPAMWTNADISAHIHFCGQDGSVHPVRLWKWCTARENVTTCGATENNFFHLLFYFIFHCYFWCNTVNFPAGGWIKLYLIQFSLLIRHPFTTKVISGHHTNKV